MPGGCMCSKISQRKSLHHSAMAKSVAVRFLVAIFASSLAMQKTGAVVPALFVFGDSTADVGNNNYLPSVAPKANFPHYGIDYSRGVPTGRFCNGFIGIDYIAKAMGYPMSPPAFLSLTSNVQTWKGVNFASAGSGILNATLWQDVTPMDEQIQQFQQVVAKISSSMGKPWTSILMARSLFAISTGSNDLFAAFTLLSPKTNAQRDQAIAPLLAKFKTQLTALYNLGARKFAVSGTGLVGCVPRARMASPTADCNKDLNDLSLRFKEATKALLQSLSSTLPRFKYAFGDAYQMGTLINANPLEFGFREIKSACCGNGKLKAETFCIPNSTYCPNRNQYYYWDAMHPTQAAYWSIAEMLLYGSQVVNFPVNIHQLLVAI